VTEIGDRLGVGILGLGGIAAHHLRGYQHNPHVRVVAVCDINPDRRAAAAEQIHDSVRTYADPDQLLADPEVALVSICTPNVHHAAQTLAALQAGKHVLVEKPVVTDPAQLPLLRQALDRTRSICAGGMILRYHPLFRHIRTLLTSGQLGVLITGGAVYWQHLNPASPNYTWLTRRTAAGSAMLSGGSHPVDLLMWLVDGTVSEVSAVSLQAANRDFDHPPTEMGLIRFDTGAVASISVCLEAPIGYVMSLDLVGARAVVRDNRLITRVNGVDLTRQLPFELPSADMRVAPFQAEIDDVVEAIRCGRQPDADLRSVLTSHEVCLALDRSAAANGQPVALDQRTGGLNV
jgi:predicted dehydrogenase